MQKLYFTNCYSDGFIRDIGICDLKKGHILSLIFDAKRLSTEQTDCIYQAKMRVGINFPYYDIIKDDVQNIYGFRYETDNINLAYIITRKETQDNGDILLELRSSINILNEVMSYPDVVTGFVTVSSIVQNLDSRFVYNLISPDREVQIESSLDKDYQVLKKIVKYADGWAFRENKLIPQGDGLWKTEILIGNFANDIEQYYLSSPETRPECKPITITSYRTFDNPLDLELVQGEGVSVSYPTSYANRLYVFGDNNQGVSQNSRTELNPSQIKQRPEFPLGASLKLGKLYYYITNTFMSPFPIREDVVVYQSTVNEEDQAGNQVLGEEVSAQKLYQFGCSRAQSYNYLPVMKVKNNLIRKFTVPGNVVYRDIKRLVKLVNGETKTVFEFKQKGILNEDNPLDASIIKN